VRYTRIVPFVVAALSGVACGASHHSAASASAMGGTSPSTSGAAGSGVTTTTRAGSVAGASQSHVTATSTTTVARAAAVNPAPTAQAPSGSAGAPADPSAAGTAGPQPAVPGTYQERQSGSFTAVGKTTAVPPQGTLVVDAPGSNGEQVWHRYVQQGQSPADTTLQFANKGIFLLSTTEQSPQGNVNCTFSPAVPAPPWPPAVGDTFASTGNCGQFTVDVTGRITGQRTFALGHSSYATWVVDTTLTFHGQVTGSGSQEDWYSPALRIPLHEYTTVHGNYGPFSFSSQLTSDVTSIP